MPYTRVNFAGRPVYQLGISFFKIALLISYLRLVKGTDQKKYRVVVWATAWLVFLSHLGCTLSLIFACTPIDKSWNPLREGTCLAPGPSFTGYAIVTIISDVVVALLPLPVLLRLNVRLEKKIGLIGLFALGLFTTLCSILRYLQINRIQHGDGNSTMLVLWGTVEFNVGVSWTRSLSHLAAEKLTSAYSPRPSVQNMVSSLPFLTPVCVKKARVYRSRRSGNKYGSSRGASRSRGLKDGDHYQLSDVSTDKGAFATADKSASEENILQSGNTIMKSVTYSVQVDDGSYAKTGRRLDDSGSLV